ncbi:MAG: hypothetical protein PHF51_03280 [Candidatus ainarchaeum sp.]|nr:hypothetical protein [Candidatus ainarchaeum sp.]
MGSKAKGPAFFALVLVAAFASLSSCLAPPSFPSGEGGGLLRISLLAPGPQATVPAGSQALAEFRCGEARYSTTAIVGPDSSLNAYPPFSGPFSVLIFVNAPGTRAAAYFTASEAAIPAGAREANVSLAPAGTVYGVTEIAGSGAQQCNVSAQCEGAPWAVIAFESGQDGAFARVLPSGNCNASLACGNGSGVSSFFVPQGRASLARLSAPLAGEQAIQQGAANVVLAVAVLAVLAFAAAFAYMAYFGRQKRDPFDELAEAIIPAQATPGTGFGKPHRQKALPLQAQVAKPSAGHAHARQQKPGPARGAKQPRQAKPWKKARKGGARLRAFPATAFLAAFLLALSGICMAQPGHADYSFGEVALRLEWLSANSTGGAAPLTGVPAMLAVRASNAGSQISEPSARATAIRFYDGGIGPEYGIGEVGVLASEALWLANGSVEKSLSWVPEKPGVHVLYAAFAFSPEPEPVGADGNAAQAVFVEPGPSEARPASLRIYAEPARVPLSGAPRDSILLRAELLDAATAQPIHGASCAAFAPDFASGEISLSWDGFSYFAPLGSSRLGVGVYNFTARCSREGYGNASASGFVAFNTAGGETVPLEAGQAEGGMRGMLFSSKSALSYPDRLRVAIERASPDDFVFARETVKVNGEAAEEFSPGALEWLFDVSQLSGDLLAITCDPPVQRANASYSPALSVMLEPVHGFCARRQPEVSITPGARSAEAGSTMSYEFAIADKDSPECGASRFAISVGNARQGWEYTAYPQSPLLNPGETASFLLTVTPRAGESPGDYKFKVEAESESGKSAFAEAWFSVTSGLMRSQLDARSAGASPALFFANYTDASGAQIGSCNLVSPLTGGNAVQMLQSGSVLGLEVAADTLPEGVYPYAIACAAPGFAPKTVYGSVRLTAGPRLPRPAITISPAIQSPSVGTPLSFSVKIHASGCSQAPIRLAASPPKGFKAELDRDTASGCGETIATLRLLPVLAMPGEPEWGSVYAFATGAPEAEARFIVAPEQADDAATCQSGAALESDSNAAVSGDPCFNWNDAHTYRLRPQGSAALYAMGKTFLQDCALPVEISVGTNSAFRPVFRASPDESGFFRASLSASGFSEVRLSSKCLMEESAVFVSGAQGAQAGISISSADFSARMAEGAPERAVVVLRNRGQADTGAYEVKAKARNGSRAIELGRATVISHAAGAEKRIELSFSPPPPGEYSLYFTAEKQDGANPSSVLAALEAGPVEVESTGGKLGFSVEIARGWNLIPFASGATLSHSCSVSSAQAFNPNGGQAFAQLGAENLSFASQADEAEFVSDNGPASSPKAAAAFGGAWLFSESQCALNFSAPLPGTGWRTLSPGFNLVAILPSDEGSTVGNLARDCALSGISEWDASSQRWAQVPAGRIISPGDAGSVLAMNARGECEIG